MNGPLAVISLTTFGSLLVWVVAFGVLPVAWILGVILWARGRTFLWVPTLAGLAVASLITSIGWSRVEDGGAGSIGDYWTVAVFAVGGGCGVALLVVAIVAARRRHATKG
jgi:hypothetical protein